jgi:hypothetical protein
LFNTVAALLDPFDKRPVGPTVDMVQTKKKKIPLTAGKLWSDV